MAVTDNFNRADGGLGVNWTTAAGFSALAIVSNACKGSFGSQHNVAIYTAGGTIAADQYGQFKVTTPGGFIGPVLRHDGATTFYTCYYNAGTATIYKWSGGGATQIGSGSTITPAVNDVVYLEVVGSALTMKVNGATVCTATDSSITGAGYTGIDLYDNVAAVDDFEGGVAGAVTVTVNLTGVAADSQIGVGTVEIGSVAPPVDTGGGGTTGRPSRTGMRLRPTEDKFVFLRGVRASPRVGQVLLRSEMAKVYEAYSAPIRRAEVQKTPGMPAGMRGLFKKVEKPIPPAVFVYQVGLPKLKSKVGTGMVKAHYEEIDEEVIAMIDLL